MWCVLGLDTYGLGATMAGGGGGGGLFPPAGGGAEPPPPPPPPQAITASSRPSEQSARMALFTRGRVSIKRSRGP